jgi:hypothetical protein
VAKKELVKLLEGLDNKDLSDILGKCRFLLFISKLKAFRLILIKYLLILVVAAYTILAIYSFVFSITIEQPLMTFASIGMLASAHFFGKLFMDWLNWLKTGNIPELPNVEKKKYRSINL